MPLGGNWWSRHVIKCITTDNLNRDVDQVGIERPRGLTDNLNCAHSSPCCAKDKTNIWKFGLQRVAMTSTPGNKLLPAPSVDGLCQMALGCEDNITVVGRSNSFNYQCSVSTHRVVDCRLGCRSLLFCWDRRSSWSGKWIKGQMFTISSYGYHTLLVYPGAIKMTWARSALTFLRTSGTRGSCKTVHRRPVPHHSWNAS